MKKSYSSLLKMLSSVNLKTEALISDYEKRVGLKDRLEEEPFYKLYIERFFVKNIRFTVNPKIKLSQRFYELLFAFSSANLAVELDFELNSQPYPDLIILVSDDRKGIRSNIKELSSKQLKNTLSILFGSMLEIYLNESHDDVSKVVFEDLYTMKHLKQIELLRKHDCLSLNYKLENDPNDFHLSQYKPSLFLN